MLSYHIWKVVSCSIVTNVSTQQFVTQVSPILFFTGYPLPSTLHPNPSCLFSHCLELFVFKHWRNRLSRCVTGHITHCHLGARCSLALAMDLVVGQHEHPFMVPYFYGMLSLRGKYTTKISNWLVNLIVWNKC